MRRFLLISIISISLLFPFSIATAAPVIYQVFDVYSSIIAYYSLADLSDANSFYEETHGAYTSSLSRTFYLGLLSGTQE